MILEWEQVGKEYEKEFSMLNPSMVREPADMPDRRSRRRKNLAARQIKVDLGVAGGLIADLSEGGMSVRMPAPLNLTPGDRLHVTVPDGQRPIQAGCELAWSTPGLAGMRFLVMSENSQRSIREWLTLEQGSGETIWIPGPAPAPKSPLLPVKPAAQNGSAMAASMPLAPQRAPAATADAPPAAQEMPRNPSTIAAAIATTAASYAAPQRTQAPAPAIPATAPPGIALQQARFELGLRLAAQLAQVLTNATGAAIALRRGNEIICRASTGHAPAVGVSLNAASGLSGECLRSGLTMRCDDTENDARVDAEVCRALGVRSLIVFPVYYRDAVAGILEVLSNEPQAFNHTDLQLLPQLAELLTRLCHKFFAK